MQWSLHYHKSKNPNEWAANQSFLFLRWLEELKYPEGKKMKDTDQNLNPEQIYNWITMQQRMVFILNLILHQNNNKKKILKVWMVNIARPFNHLITLIQLQ